MKKLITLLLICFAFAAKAQTIQQLKKDMNGIASDATEGRFTGSPGHLKAAHIFLNLLLQINTTQNQNGR